MKTYHLIIMLACSVLLAFSSCQKSDPQLEELPAATQTGANTFGCLVNGIAFLPSGRYLAFDNSFICRYYTTYSQSDSEFLLAIGNADADHATRRLVILIGKKFITQGDRFTLGNYYNGDSNYTLYEDIYNESPTNSFGSDGGLQGGVQITKLDETNHIISGTFFFDAKNDKGETIHITDGRFDMTYGIH